VRFVVRKNVLADYVKAGALINTRRYGLVVLMHEFGIFGPPPVGEYVLCLVQSLQVPLVALLHTVGEIRVSD
jgi:hypothetical protein